MDSIIDSILQLCDIYSLEGDRIGPMRDEPIVKVALCTYPVRLAKILNTLSDGRLEESMRDYGCEQLSSVKIILNDTYMLQKGYRPKIRRLRKPFTGTTIEIDIPENCMGITINDFVTKAKRHMGTEMFRNYSFTMNNCQHFTWACLVANHLTDNIPNITQVNVDKIIHAWLARWLGDIIIGILDH